MVKATGDLAFMLPDRGNMQTVPFDLTVALQHAFRIVSWQEELKPKEMPPQWMWPHADELKEWFEEVDTVRRQEYGMDDDDDWGSSDDETVPMSQNELSDRFRD